MLQRCYNPNATGYSRYGGSGVEVCDRWRDSFENFYADMGPRPPKMTLDRFPDTKGDYSPSNCRWATNKEQNEGRGMTVFIEYNGERMCAADWDKKMGYGAGTVAKRMKRKWTTEKAIMAVPVYVTKPLEERIKK